MALSVLLSILTSSPPPTHLVSLPTTHPHHPTFTSDSMLTKTIFVYSFLKTTLRIQVMRSILYLAAALAVVGITLAAPAPAPVEVAEEWCYCEPDFRGQKPRKSPDCCY
ncbi:hypothetical protein BG000_000531 [Podila horticola]|nr:hypothetical protein BG000_000531 [Podila horticola]